MDRLEGRPSRRGCCWPTLEPGLPGVQPRCETESPPFQRRVWLPMMVWTARDQFRAHYRFGACRYNDIPASDVNAYLAGLCRTSPQNNLFHALPPDFVLRATRLGIHSGNLPNWRESPDRICWRSSGAEPFQRSSSARQWRTRLESNWRRSCLRQKPEGLTGKRDLLQPARGAVTCAKLSAMVSSCMRKRTKSLAESQRQMLDMAEREFDGTGTLPPLRLRFNPGSGRYSISSIPDDCEDGMRTTVHVIPTVRQCWADLLLK